MATLSNVTLGIVRNVANADITLSYTILWSSFDQLTNLSYTSSFRLIGDDTNQDGDNLPVGDDAISVGLQPLRFHSSNGQPSTTVNVTPFSIPWVDLDEDGSFAVPAAKDDEIRAVVTLTPQLPVATSRESAMVPVLSP
jgi:hypothetical protein